MAIVIGCTLIGAIAGAICGGLICHAIEKKYPLFSADPDRFGADSPVMGAIIITSTGLGGVAGFFIGRSILYRATDEFKELRVTRDTRKNEFEGYMMGAGLSGMMEEFKAEKK